MPNVQGVGGVIIYSNDPAPLGEWYKTHLGIDLHYSGSEGCYHAIFTDPETGRQTAFGLMPAKTPTPVHSRAIMVDYRVDDLDALVKELEQKGITIEDRSDGEYGKFAHIKDPEGNPIEIWQAPPE